MKMLNIAILPMQILLNCPVRKSGSEIERQLQAGLESHPAAVVQDKVPHADR
jgi:hypothetical protein